MEYLTGAELFVRETPKKKRSFIARCIEVDPNSDKEKQFYAETESDR